MTSNAPIFFFDWAPDAIIVTGHDGSVLHVNPRAEDLFGYRKDELSNKPLELLIPEGLTSAEPESSPMQHLSRAVVCAHRDGTRFAGTARWRPAPAGHGDYVVFAIRNLDGAEEARTYGAAPAPETAAAADGQERPRIEPISLLAHDVRESLQAVQYLCDGLRSRAPAEAKAISEIIGSVSALLERLTGISRTHALDPVVEPCRLDELLVKLGRELTPHAERKGLRLSVDAGVDVIMTDGVLLRELLHNLLANAIRYTDTGRVEVRCRAGSDHLRVDITDTGIGIDPARLTAIWEPCAIAVSDRIDDPARPHGARLGLVIVQCLASVLCCRLEVDSTPGGSRFTVVVPRDLGARRR